MKNLTLIILLSTFSIQAQVLDTVCFTKPEYDAMAEEDRKGVYARNVVIPELRGIINQQSDTIIKYSIRNEQLQTENLNFKTAPKPKRGLWFLGGVGLGIVIKTIFGWIQ